MQQTNLTVTTYCSRRCPLCCVRSGLPEHYSWEYFVDAARYLHGIPTLHLTGGEPTAHPGFARLVIGLPRLFGCKRLALWTNGYGWPYYRKSFEQFDLIHVSHYTPETYPGCEDNTETVQAMKQALGDRVRIEADLVHVPMKATGRTKPCGRLLRENVTYSDGKAWPCCVGPGPKSAKGIELTDNWKEAITQMAPPCDTCGFAL